MSTPSENVASVNQAAFENFLPFLNIAFNNTARLTQLNLKAARAFLDDAADNARALAGAKEIRQVVELQTHLTPHLVERLVAYSREVGEISSHTQKEVAGLVDVQRAQTDGNAGSAIDQAARYAPAGADGAFGAFRSVLAASNAAFANVHKAAAQAVGFAENAAESANKAGAKAVAATTTKTAA